MKIKFADLFRALSVVLAVSLAGCAIEPATLAVLDAYRLNRAEEGSQSSAVGLNPDFKYLRVQVDERVILMVLGYVEPLKDGPVYVWYSADGDVLRLREGRVVGASLKLGTSWLGVSFSNLPDWKSMGERAEFERLRDESPGYRYGIKEKVRIRRIPPPDDSRLESLSAASLGWFEEQVQGAEYAYPARYAVSTNESDGVHRVIYAEQCLSSEYCFSWQIWPSSEKGVR